MIDRVIDWFELRDGVYVPRAQGTNGIIESSRFPGLRLHVPSMLAGDAPASWLPLVRSRTPEPRLTATTAPGLRRTVWSRAS